MGKPKSPISIEQEEQMVEDLQGCCRRNRIICEARGHARECRRWWDQAGHYTLAQFQEEFLMMTASWFGQPESYEQAQPGLDNPGFFLKMERRSYVTD